MALRFQHAYFLEGSVAIQAIDITTDPSCSRKIDPEIALSKGSTECHHGSSSNKATGHPDKYSSNSSKALKHQNDLRWLSRSQASAQPSLLTGALNINTDMALGSGPVPDDTVASGDSAGHLDRRGPGSGMALVCQQGHRLWPRPWTSTQPLVALQAMDVNTDPSWTWSSAAAQPQMTSWPQVTAQTTQIGITSDSFRSQRHQSRLWLLQSHEVLLF